MTPTSNSDPSLKGVAKKEDHVFDDALVSLLKGASLACIATDHSRKISDWNASAESLLGWTADEVLNRPLSDVLSGEIAPRRPSLLSLRKKDGTVLSAEIWNAPLPGGQVFLLQDITEKNFLESALLEAFEKEQHRIGHELHEHLCQHLLGAAFAAKGLAGALEREDSPHALQLHEMARLINEAVAQVRDISRGLHPVEFDGAGLMSALQELSNRAAHTADCTFRCDSQILIHDADTAMNAYRIAQAGVTTALQQTGAKKIGMTLSRTGDFIRLEIFDDGKKEGELTSDAAGVAAKIMHYRVEAMQGTLSLDFDPATGTRLTCLFPS